MNKWADRSEEMSPKWNAPVAKTTYPAEIERFWNRTRSLHEARVNHWTKGAKHLTASINKVNNTVTEWKKTSEKVSENLLSLVKAQETAEYFMGNSTKYGGEIIKDDLHQLDKVVLDLENVSAPPHCLAFA